MAAVGSTRSVRLLGLLEGVGPEGRGSLGEELAPGALGVRLLKGRRTAPGAALDPLMGVGTKGREGLAREVGRVEVEGFWGKSAGRGLRESVEGPVGGEGRVEGVDFLPLATSGVVVAGPAAAGAPFDAFVTVALTSPAPAVVVSAAAPALGASAVPSRRGALTRFSPAGAVRAVEVPA